MSTWDLSPAQRGNRLTVLKEVYLEGHDLALTVLYVPSLDSAAPAGRVLPGYEYMGFVCRAKREKLERFEGQCFGSQGQNLALTVLSVPCSLDSAASAGRVLSRPRC
jgi:hypothetical protein